MTTRHKFFSFAAIAMAISGLPGTSYSEEPIPVVATFSILGDMVQRVGGDAIELTTLVGRNGDTHVYQPTPADAKAISRAEILFTNGLDFEGWLERLAEAAEFKGVSVVTTDGLELIAMQEHHDDEHDDDHNNEHDDEHAKEEETQDADGREDDEHKDEHDDDEHSDSDGHDDHHDHGEFDPHGWLSLKNAVVYVDNIAEALAIAAPESASMFYQNRAAYIAEIELLDGQIKDMISALPASERTIVTSHDAFQYFARDYGLIFLAPQGLSTESEASAREVADLIEQIRAEGISAVFVENVADPRLLEQIARETGSTIGGKLYPGALSKTDEPAPNYLDLMRHNATTIAKALTDG